MFTIRNVATWMALGVASIGLSACGASTPSLTIPKVVRTEAEALRRIDTQLGKALCSKPCTPTTPNQSNHSNP